MKSKVYVSEESEQTWVGSRSIQCGALKLKTAEIPWTSCLVYCFSVAGNIFYNIRVVEHQKEWLVKILGSKSDPRWPKTCPEIRCFWMFAEEELRPLRSPGERAGNDVSVTTHAPTWEGHVWLSPDVQHWQFQREPRHKVTRPSVLRQSEVHRARSKGIGLNNCPLIITSVACTYFFCMWLYSLTNRFYPPFVALRFARVMRHVASMVKFVKDWMLPSLRKYSSLHISTW